MDKATLIRSMSYTPNGLFNHTAAIYQMLTGYPPDKVSPSGQLEPPNAADFPTAGSHICKLKPPKEPVLPFVEMPRPLQESSIIGKGGAAGFLGKAYDPYRMYQDPAQEDQARRPRSAQRDAARTSEGSLRTAERHQRLHAGPRKGVGRVSRRRILRQSLSTWSSAAKRAIAIDLTKEPDKMRERYGLHTFGQSLLMARRLIEAGTRFVQVNWPSVANGDPEKTAWDTHAANFGPLKNLHCPKLDRSSPRCSKTWTSAAC